MTRKLWLPVLSLIVAAGCGGPRSRVVDENEPAFVDARQVQDDDFIKAAREMSKKISEKTAAGWPSHVLKTEDGLPVARWHGVQNRTRAHFDVVKLRNEIYNILVEQANVYLVTEGDDGAGGGAGMEAVEQEREYSQAGMTDQEIPTGQEDRTSLVMVGEITDEKVEQDGVEQRTYTFSLRLIDTVKKRIVVVVQKRVRKERE